MQEYYADTGGYVRWLHNKMEIQMSKLQEGWDSAALAVGFIKSFPRYHSGNLSFSLYY